MIQGENLHESEGLRWRVRHVSTALKNYELNTEDFPKYIWEKNDENKHCLQPPSANDIVIYCYHVLSQCFDTLWTQSNWKGKTLLLLRCDSHQQVLPTRLIRPSKSKLAFWKRNLDPEKDDPHPTSLTSNLRGLKPVFHPFSVDITCDLFLKKGIGQKQKTWRFVPYQGVFVFWKKNYKRKTRLFNFIPYHFRTDPPHPLKKSRISHG